MFGVLRPNSPERDRMLLSPNASPPPPGSLAPMPPSEFPSRDTLLTGAKDWAASQSYAVVIARSRANRLWLKCDRGGTYENRRNLTPDQRKRKRGDSRLLGCPFKMLATCRKDGVWRVETTVAEHNHGPSEDLSAHPTLRRMTDEQLQRVKDMCDGGKSPAETLEELKAVWPDIKVLTRDIYNARKKHKTEKELEELAGGMPHVQHFQDPNDLGLPGPDQHGRWAWVPDGEEVTNKKRRRRTAPLSHPPVAAGAHTTLDPQLQTPDASQTSRDPGQQLLEYAQSVPPRNGQPQYNTNRYNPAPNTTLDHSTANGTSSTPSFYPKPADDQTEALTAPQPLHHPPFPPTTTPTRLRSHRAPTAFTAPPPIPTTNKTTSPNAATAPQQQPNGVKGPSGQVLMTRIERMEKEQRDQKNMLAQILGAVQGMSGSPMGEEGGEEGV